MTLSCPVALCHLCSAMIYKTPPRSGSSRWQNDEGPHFYVSSPNYRCEQSKAISWDDMENEGKLFPTPWWNEITSVLTTVGSNFVLVPESTALCSCDATAFPGGSDSPSGGCPNEEEYSPPIHLAPAHTLHLSSAGGWFRFSFIF